MMHCFRIICRMSQSHIATPLFYNPNISLISNIAHTKKLEQLLSLHQSISSKFTPKHLAHAARKITQIIKLHKSNKAQRRFPIVAPTNSSQWTSFLAAVRATDLSGVSGEQFISFATFLQKMAKFKPDLTEGLEEIGKIEGEFKSKILKKFDEISLQAMTFQQICSLLNALWQSLSANQQLKILNCMRARLLKDPYCTSFHLMLLVKHLASKQSSHQQLIQQIQGLSFALTKQQLDAVQGYMHPRALIQVFDAFFPTHPQEITCLLPVILSRMKENSTDISLHAAFFEDQLNLFKRYISTIKEQKDVISQLSLMIKAGKKTHAFNYFQSNYIENVLTAENTNKKGKFFKKKVSQADQSKEINRNDL